MTMNGNSINDRLDRMMATSPYIRHWGLAITSIELDAKTLIMRMPWLDEVEGEDNTGYWHGGPIVSLADTAGCFAAIMLDTRNAGTVALNIDYVRPASGAFLVATAHVRKAGRAFSTVEIDITDASERLVAVARGTFYFMQA